MKKLILIGFLSLALGLITTPGYSQANPFGDNDVTLTGTSATTSKAPTAVSAQAAATTGASGWVRQDMAVVEGKMVRLIKDAVNLRSGPGTTYGVLSVGTLGSRYPLIGAQGGWYQFSLAVTPTEKNVGYFRKDMGTLRGHLVVVTVDTVNVRGGPSTGHKVVKRADFGAVFEFIAEEDGWYKFSLGEPRRVGPPSDPAAIEAAQAQFMSAYRTYSQTVRKSGRSSKAGQAALAEFRRTYLEYKLLARDSQVVRDLRTGQKKIEKVVVSKADFTATVYVDGQIARIYPVAYGNNPDGLNKKAQGDSRTPEGTFKVAGKAVNPAYQPLKIPGGAPNNPFGTRWMGLNTWGGSIGLHGTSNPLSIGTRASHGCVRMFTPDAEELFELIRVGTPVIIKPVKDG